MAKSIEERVVQMKFENGQFEKGVETSINSINSLKKSMDFEDAVKGFHKLDESAKAVDMSGLEKAVETVRLKFTLLDTIILEVKSRIAKAIVDIGQSVVKMSKSLSIDQLGSGWDKYAEKTSAVQTIMAATASKFSDTATQMAVVNEQLDRLNWFTDETSYKFLDMVGSIGKFTSNNVDLETSVTAMQGIANWAAKSGANVNEAGRAMYNLSQAIAVGAVKLIDWKSIENANMATAEFKQNAIETAAALGTLIKTGEDAFTTLDGKIEISTKTFAGFTDSLSKEWFTSDVLLKTLDKYGAASNKIHEIYEELNGDVLTTSIIGFIEDYTKAVDNARAKAEELGLSSEETARKAEEAGKEIAQQVADEWNVTLEQATQWLSAFDNEVMQFGLKAFKAGQETKTFQEAVDAVKEAVSSGWMQSYEIVFGDYEEAKELWSEVTEQLYEFFAESASARNSMLRAWKEMGGHEYVVDIIIGLMKSLNNLKYAAMEGVELVFGKLDANVLIDFTKAIHGFVLAITPSAEALTTFSKAVAAVLTPVDILITLLRGAGAAAIRLFKGLMGDANIDILQFVGNAADAVLAFRTWFHESTLLTDGVNKVVDRIIELKNVLVGFKDATMNDPVFLTAVGFFRDFFLAAFTDISNYVGFAKDRFVEFFTWLRTSAPKITSLEDIGQIFEKFYNTVLKDLLDLEKRFPAVALVIKDTSLAIQRYLGPLGDSFMIFIEEPLKFMSDLLLHLIGELGEFVMGIKAVDIAVAAVAIGVWQALANIGKIFDTLSGVVSAIKKILDGFTNMLKGWLKSKSIKEYAKAIMYLAIALKMLSTIEPERAWQSVALISALGAAVIIMAKAMDTIKGGKLSVAVFAAIGLSVLAIVGALKVLDGIKAEDLNKDIMILSGAIIALGAVSLLLTKFAPSFQSMGGAILAFSAGVYLLVASLKQLKGMEPQTMLGGILAVTAIILALGVAVKTMTKVVPKDWVAGTATAGTLLAFAISVKLLIGAIKSISKIDIDAAMTGIMEIGLLMAEIAIAMRIMGSGVGGSMKAGGTILALAIALNLLTPAIKSLAKIEDAELQKAKDVIMQLGLIFVAAVGLSALGGKNSAQAGLMLIEMAAAITILTIAVRAMGGIETETLKKGVTAVTILGLMMSAAIGASHLTKEARLGIQAMAVCLGILALSVWELSKLPFANLAASASAMGGMILSLGIAMGLMGKMKVDAKILVSLGTMAAVIAEIAYLTYKLVQLENIDKAIYAAGAIGIVLVSLAASLRILNKAEGFKDTTVLGNIAGLGIIAVAVAAFITLFADIFPNADVMKVIGIAAALDLLIPMLTASMLALDKIKSAPNKTTMKKFEIMAGTFAIIGAGLYALAAKLPGDETTIRRCVGIVAAIDMLLPVMVGCMAGLSTIRSGPPKTVMDALSNMAGIVAGLMALLALLSLIPEENIMTAIGLAAAIDMLLPVLTGCFVALDRFAAGNASTDDVLLQFLEFGLIVEGLVGIIAILASIADYDMNQIMGFVLAIDALLPVLAGCFVVIDKFTSGGISDDALASFFVFGIIVDALIAIIVALAAISGDNTDKAMQLVLAIDALLVVLTPCFMAVIPIGKMGPDVILAAGIAGLAIDAIGALLAMLVGLFGMFPPEVLQQGAQNSILIGEAIGGFFGGILGGLVEGVITSLMNILPALGTALSEFISNATGFFTGITSLDQSDIEKVGLLAGVVMALTAADFLYAIESLVSGVLDAFFGWIKPDLRDKFTQFGQAVAAFAKSCGDVDADQVKAAAEAAGILVTLEQSVPPQGGALQAFLGNKNLGDFGKRLIQFGIFLKSYVIVTKGITEEDVAGSAAAGSVLAALEDSLPAQDGLVQKWFGEKDLGEFGARLKSFGTALKEYVAEVKGITEADVQGSVNAGQILADLEHKLVFSGGFVTNFLFGSQDLGQFGERLETLGSGLKGYAEDVKGITADSVQGSADAISILAELEKTLDPSGGVYEFWFGGDRSFADFGKNLESLGTALQKFDDSIADIHLGKILNATSAIDMLIDLAKEITTTDTWAQNLVDTINGIVTYFLTELSAKESDIKNQGEEIIHWLVEGFGLGFTKYYQRAYQYGEWIANKVKQGVEQTLEIASPSAVMEKDGHWVVKGLAEGIEKDTSAEDAASKKASNIEAAFKSVFEKSNTLGTKYTTEYNLWTLTEGKRLGVLERFTREYKLGAYELQRLMDESNTYMAQMEAYRKTFGESSDKFLDAQNKYNQSLIAVYEKRAEIIDNAFTSLIEQSDKVKERSSVEYELWTFTDGKNADDITKIAKEYEYGVKELKLLADQSQRYLTRMEYYRQEYGEFSEEYLDAEKDYQQSLINMYKQQDTLEELASQQIAKPSAILTDLGAWMVKNLAYGITSDMSAEEAAAQKAQNIADSFQKHLDTLDLMKQLSDSEYALWQARDGVYLSESDQMQKQYDNDLRQLEHYADLARVELAKLEVIRQELGEDDEQYAKQLIASNNALTQTYNQRKDIYSSYGASVKNDRKQIVDEINQYIKEGEMIAEMMGWTKDQIADYAAQRVGFVDWQAYGKAISTNDFSALNPFLESVEALVDGLEEPVGIIVSESVDSTLSNAISKGVANIDLSSIGVENALDLTPIMESALTFDEETLTRIVSETGELLGKGLADIVEVTFKDDAVAKKASKNVTKSVSKAVKQGMTDAAPAANEGGKDLGGNAAQGFSDGVKSKITSIRDAADSAIDNFIPPLKNLLKENSPSKVTFEIGDYATLGFINGIGDRVTEVFNASYNIGSQVSIGLKQGIIGFANEAIQAAQQVAQQVAATMASTLGVASPSTVGYDIGKFVGIGVGNGLDASVSYVKESSDNLANVSIDALSNVRSQIETILNSDDDMLTLTPVLDMDALRDQARSISGVLNSGKALNIRASNLQVNSIAARKSETANQNGSSGVSGDSTTNYNFTQNNYSPKALSRAEIYRQTRNQFSQLKGATKR